MESRLRGQAQNVIDCCLSIVASGVSCLLKLNARLWAGKLIVVEVNVQCLARSLNPVTIDSSGSWVLLLFRGSCQILDHSAVLISRITHTNPEFPEVDPFVSGQAMLPRHGTILAKKRAGVIAGWIRQKPKRGSECGLTEGS